MAGAANSLTLGDGRTARRDRNRLAVLDAVIELFADNVEPSPEVVAQRCSLSPRSVYRYFADRDELMRAAIEYQLECVRPFFVIHALGEGPLEERITRFATSRVSLYLVVANVARAARARARRDATIAERVKATHVALREQCARHFALELGALDDETRGSVLGAVDALTQFEALDFLVAAHEMDPDELRRTLSVALRRLLFPSP